MASMGVCVVIVATALVSRAKVAKVFCGRSAGRGGVIRITWVVIDKAGFNWLFVPHQSPFPLSAMAPSRPTNTYTIPFDPLNNGPGEFASAKEVFNYYHFVHKRGSRVTLYPVFASVYTRSKRCVINADTFNDLFLVDFVDANKRWGAVEGTF
jgi:hypothetical protein